MSTPKNSLELKFERTIPAATTDVYDAWLNPAMPGTPWNMGDKLILHPAVDDFFYWLVGKTAHYGRFTVLDRGARIQHTWVSPNTDGEESMVTVTFQKRGSETLMTLVHSGLPDTSKARGHEGGWNHFLDSFPAHFAKVPAAAR